MREGDVVIVVGKISNKIKDMPVEVMGTYIGSVQTSDSSVCEILLGDGSIYRVKTKDIKVLYDSI